jgi:uncharacterized protein DUF4189
MGRVEPSDWTATLRAVVVAALMLGITAVSVVTFTTARAAGALAVGSCGAYGQSYDFPDLTAARDSALAQCQGGECKVVATVKRGCTAYSVDGTNPCGPSGWAKGTRLGQAQNEALRSCYKAGGKDCVIRTFLCDAKG